MKRALPALAMILTSCASQTTVTELPAVKMVTAPPSGEAVGTFNAQSGNYAYTFPVAGDVSCAHRMLRGGYDANIRAGQFDLINIQTAYRNGQTLEFEVENKRTPQGCYVIGSTPRLVPKDVAR